MTKTKIGILGLQGAVREHLQSVIASGAEGVVIKQKEQLDEIDGLILPGGESTTMRRLIDKYDFFDALVAFGKKGKPIFGTCAGLILLAKNIVGSDSAHLQLMDIKVERNAFGRQIASFEADLNVKDVGEGFNAVFIRAPYVVEASDDVDVLATYNGKIVAARQNHYLCSAFHPELTDDHRMASYFVKMVEESKSALATQ
ncbi:pyridoxal 5'-phosphate synthase glutaminase subunit PdxT [Aquibacillus sp. 3ASR75-11]|uniref:Pyridoxal 5'-phosphate synthase subunit PdxT n=1 Tax=Terrihalobacillus insolitus TaxID=2950438 RepID=A0A9X3WUP3_9BACI|nr:pyridoxal 5'-phosphate synthase glutaminase subunit PdxT [Terrihalobacillus insolitus]MDC3414897.1 pyridoxal 5'-phosphate synthase glutaminase subunit PdxT [Terrihalobacillus insolitus]MDC3426107.1 pyridoxal 5'-phosphate synthase glutaminase subunit PdxT [Terrihalobacillus insolitus]